MIKNIFFSITLISILSCSKDEPTIADFATITTTPVLSITANNAVSGGTISNNGGAAVTAYGICWNTQTGPTVSNFKTIDGTGNGTFTSNLTQLVPNKTYYVRAYATNSKGTSYGNELTFQTSWFSPTEPMYFPPLNSQTVWETKTPTQLGWNQSAVQPLLDFLALKNSKSFIILVNGRMVMENYFNGHSATAPWYWASAGKTLTTCLSGISEQEGLININNKVSDYLGSGWTGAPIAKENLITCKNLLSMTSGLDDTLGDGVLPADLQYVADAGTRWAYHNVYVKMQDVIAQASGLTWSNYFNTKLRDRIGMTGIWNQNGGFSVYYSNTRSMARFGLLNLNKGKWENNQILNENFFTQATNTSQNLNQAYGYLWWLNGKMTYRLPQSQLQFNGSLIPNGPNDMFMALGKDDQKIYVIPSKKMVVIRMGDAADGTNFALSNFDNELWIKITALYQ